MNRIKKILKLFVYEDPNKKLLKNIERYEQKKREKQNEISSFKRDKLDRQKVKEV